MPADAIIRLLGLQPHPEGGHFCETLRDAPRYRYAPLSDAAILAASLYFAINYRNLQRADPAT